MYDQFKRQGLEVVAINLNDAPETISKYAADSKFTFHLGMCKESDPVWQKYGAVGCPTNYLLDAEGKVVWRQAGFEEQEVRAALKKLGLE